MKESVFQKQLIKEIESRFPECIVLKNDATYMQGIPDLLILLNNFWAALEVKNNEKASHRPNQDYYIQKLNEMSFSAFIYPENKEVILNEMEQSYKRCARRNSRISRGI